MNRDPFATLIFRGKRFDGAVMPLEALPELAAYRDLVIAVAKSLFQAANPERKRLPNGFESSFRLVMDAVEHGSAIPSVLRVTDDQTTLPDHLDFFDNARDLIEIGIGAMASGQTPPHALTSDLLARFNAFGRTLDADDAIVVARPNTKVGAVYTREVRRQALRWARMSFEDDVTLVGEVRAADKDSSSFTLRVADGQKVELRARQFFFPMLFRSLNDAVMLSIRGVGIYDADGGLQKVTSVEDVSLAEEGVDASELPGCATPFERQVEALRVLDDRWFDESSRAFKAPDLDWLSKLVRGVLDNFKLPTPYVYPTPEGAARLEWSVAAWEVVTTIDLAKRTADSFAARQDASDELHELPSMLLSDPGAESTLGRFLGEHLQQTS